LLDFLPRLLGEISRDNGYSESYAVSIVVVDDGSLVPVNFDSLEYPLKSERCQIHLLRHPINLGQGAALQTALEYGLNFVGADFFATMDSDGQHSESDLFPMLSSLINSNCEIVFGNRFSKSFSIDMPLMRRLLLKAAVQFERILTGLDLNDSHNGFRVFTRQCASRIDLKLNRMAHATEFKQIIRRHKSPYLERFVTIRYTKETLAKGQKNSGAFLILRDLMKTYLFERF
jgi:glycosyltransferase involved in cell wall biosynthesis